MSSTELVVVPDRIEPVEAFRCWNLVNGKLVSITNGEEWKPGEPLKAECRGGAELRWTFAKTEGMSREQATNLVEEDRQWREQFYSQHLDRSRIPSVPATEPPDGFGFLLEVVGHDCPTENCACGIYAVATAEQIPTSGQIYGKVKLWGKVIPGERGYRAEFAYPSEFWVPSDMEPDDTLLAFDVPIILKDDLPSSRDSKTGGFVVNPIYSGNIKVNGVDLSSYVTSFDFDHSYGRTWPRWIYGAVALNIACAAFNLLGAFHVI